MTITRENPRKTLNVKKILEVWDWLNFSQGRDGQPLWYQATWVTELEIDNRVSKAFLDHSGNGYRDLVAQGETEGYCGTGCCVAGFVALPATHFNRNGGTSLLTQFEIDGEKYRLKCQDWQEAGQLILGISYNEASQLFYGDNTKEDIKRIFNDILAAHGEEIRL